MVGRIFTNEKITKWMIEKDKKLSTMDADVLLSPYFWSGGYRWKLKLEVYMPVLIWESGHVKASLISDHERNVSVPRMSDVQLCIRGLMDKFLKMSWDGSSRTHHALELVTYAELDSWYNHPEPKYHLLICEIVPPDEYETRAGFCTTESENAESCKTDVLHSSTQTDEPGEKEIGRQSVHDITTSGKAFSLTKGVEKLLEDYRKLFISRKEADITLKVKTEEFKAHKLILQARSPVFLDSLKHDTVGKATDIVTIEDNDPETIKDFLHYIYTGRIENLSPKNVLALYTTADKYHMEELKEECVESMK